jgi:hypothetical protein
MPATRVRRVVGVLGMLAVALLVEIAHAEVRFYRIRDDGFLENLHLVRGKNKPGCHNLSGFRKAHRIAVIDFSYCSVYSSDDCAPGTEIPAYWKKKPDRKETRLTEGSLWYLDPETNVKLGSWQCVE